MTQANESATVWKVDILKGGDGMTAITVLVAILGAIKLTDILVAFDK